MSKLIDIETLDAVAESEAGFKLNLKGTDGAEIGLILNVLGRHSNAVQTWVKKTYQRIQREEAMAKRKGKEAEPLDLDELKEQNIEAACIRVTGWEGAKQPFSKELLKTLLTRNPHFIDQIIEESNNDANFTKAS
jgi:hypothetical protein